MNPCVAFSLLLSSGIYIERVVESRERVTINIVSGVGLLLLGSFFISYQFVPHGFKLLSVL